MSDQSDQNDRRLEPIEIIKREPQDDGSELLTYSCGHTAIAIIANTVKGGFPCAQCIHDLMDERRRKP